MNTETTNGRPYEQDRSSDYRQRAAAAALRRNVREAIRLVMGFMVVCALAAVLFGFVWPIAQAAVLR